MAALRPGQAKAGADGAMIGTPETRVPPRPGRYEIDTSCPAATFQTRHLFWLAPVRASFAIRAGRSGNPHRHPPLPLGSPT
jgi:hypothetical protein